jgi:hypothetical protein
MGSLAVTIRQLAEWMPALPMLSAISGALTTSERVGAVLRLMRFAATKTETKIDDVVLLHVEAVLLSKEGQELLDCVIRILGNVSLDEVKK